MPSWENKDFPLPPRCFQNTHTCRCGPGANAIWWPCSGSTQRPSSIVCGSGCFYCLNLEQKWQKLAFTFRCPRFLTTRMASLIPRRSGVCEPAPGSGGSYNDHAEVTLRSEDGATGDTASSCLYWDVKPSRRAVRKAEKPLEMLRRSGLCGEEPRTPASCQD